MRALRLLAHLHLLSNDYAQALHCIETVLTSEKDHPQQSSLFFAARIHLLMQEPLDSLSYLTKCHKDHFPSTLLTGNILLESGNNKIAAKYFKHAVDLKP